MNFKEELEQKVQRINEVIKSYLPREEGFQKTLMEAMNYSMLSGGKRLRPLLMQETYRMFGGTERVVEPFMAAMEMIHTHSLIHDDLPALDNDEYRRGRKTTHVVYGEAMAILAGDALLNYAYETAAMSFSMDEDRKRTTEAFRILTKKTGVYGMLGGQCVDVQSEGQAVSKEKLDFIYRLKTSALIEASMMVGAVLGGATKEQVSIVEKAARDVGLAFQIQDDILDLTSTTEILGKPVGSDEKNQKTTYVTLHGLEQSRSDVEKISRKAIEVLKGLPGENEFLLQLIQMLITREK